MRNPCHSKCFPPAHRVLSFTVRFQDFLPLFHFEMSLGLSWAVQALPIVSSSCWLAGRLQAFDGGSSRLPWPLFPDGWFWVWNTYLPRSRHYVVSVHRPHLFLDILTEVVLALGLKPHICNGDLGFSQRKTGHLLSLLSPY